MLPDVLEKILIIAFRAIVIHLSILKLKAQPERHFIGKNLYFNF